MKSPRVNPDGDSMRQNNKVQMQATASSKKKNTKSKRLSAVGGQDLDSSNISPTKHLPRTSPKSSAKKKRRRISHNQDDSLISVSSKRSRLSESEIDVDEVTISPQRVSPPKSARSPKKISGFEAKTKNNKSPHKKKMGSHGNETDVSWEMAVKQARGLPDGSLGQEKVAGMSPGGKKQKKESKTPFEKKNKKPLNVIQTAAKKLKNMGKHVEEKKGIKRKHDSGTKDGGEKKAKLEEMSYKDRKKQRKMHKDNYVMGHQAKRLWEELRQTNLAAEKRKELSTALYNLVKDNAKELIFAHDTSRVIQCLMKYGMPEHKNALVEELREHIVEMSKSKYAKFFVRKLLKYGTKGQRNYVFRKLYGNVRKLIRHKEAAEIVECAYNDYANALQRSQLMEEFYGPSFALFKSPEVRTLDQIMKSHPDRRETILSNMKEAVSVLVEKTILQYSIVHRVFMEYFIYASDKARAEMIETLREGVVQMLHTRDGSRVAMTCLWHGTAKDRKVIVKSFKTFVAKICKEEYGHLVLLAMFDVVDDTKLIQKAILDELLKSANELAVDQYGRKVLLYLLSPRDHVHFHPDVINILEQGDSNVQSKKDKTVRRKELLDYVSRPIVQCVVEKCKELVLNNSSFLLILAAITHVTCDPTEAMRAVAQIAAEPFATSSQDNFHIVEHPAGHLALKRLIINDGEMMKKGETVVLFSNILLDILPDGCLKSWAACNRGCLILVSLLELSHPEIKSKVSQQLAGIKKSLKKMEFKGAQVLYNKLKEEYAELKTDL